MSWEDRIQEAAYVSPAGVRTVFQYQNVSKRVAKRTTAFEFPDADGTYVQDLGHTGRRFPLRVFFSGTDYDREVASFEAALLERGQGKLEHPIYGSVDVVPFGEVKRRDDLLTAANQAILEITFFETTGIIYPDAQENPADQVLAAVQEYNTAAANELSEVVRLDTQSLEASLENVYLRLFDFAGTVLRPIADTQEDTRVAFAAIGDSIAQGTELNILTLAFQTAIYLQTPARALTNIKARLDGYGNLARSIITGDSAVADPPTNLGITKTKASNDFHIKDLYASTYVTGSVLSVVNTQFSTKPAALSAAEVILAEMDAVTDWRDDNFEALNEIDIGGSYQQLQEAVALCAGFLVEISFALAQERRVVLAKEKTIIELVAELYGEVDPRLDFFIASNDLAGDEILELSRGREVVYYV